jgi:hypothetical protein
MIYIKQLTLKCKETPKTRSVSLLLIKKKKSRNLEDMKARQIMLKSQINFNNRKKKGNAKWKKSSIRKMSPKRKVTRANPRCI